MRSVDNVTNYSVEEILLREDNVRTEGEIIAFLEAHPACGKWIGGQWHSHDLAIHIMNKPEEFTAQYLAGALGFDFSNLRFSGKVLDVGEGGEGIIGQAVGDQAVGIAPEEHRQGLERAPGCGLKIMMDARDMKFLDNTFDAVTAFFTLMYIDHADHERVFREIYRVLKPGGAFYLWDMMIPEHNTPGKTGYMMAIEVQLKDRKVLTGYGARWAGKQQDMAWFKGLAMQAGFRIAEETQGEHLVCLLLVK